MVVILQYSLGGGFFMKDLGENMMRKGKRLSRNESTTNTFEVHKKAGTPKTENRVGKSKLSLNIMAENQPTQNQIQIIKAKAWVNTQPVEPTAGGTLIVYLNYNSNDHGVHSLRPAHPQGINTEILLLEITFSSEMIFISNPRQASYSQGLQTQDQYSSIEFIYKGEKVGSINDIAVAN